MRTVSSWWGLGWKLTPKAGTIGRDPNNNFTVLVSKLERYNKSLVSSIPTKTTKWHIQNVDHKHLAHTDMLAEDSKYKMTCFVFDKEKKPKKFNTGCPWSHKIIKNTFLEKRSCIFATWVGSRVWWWSWPYLYSWKIWEEAEQHKSLNFISQRVNSSQLIIIIILLA